MNSVEPPSFPSRGRRTAAAAGRGIAGIVGVVIGALGAGLVGLNLWISFVRKVDTRTGAVTDPPGNSVAGETGTGPVSDLTWVF